MPKVKGGLGLRKTEDINKAFQCKLKWKILTDEESLWFDRCRQSILNNKIFSRVQRKHHTLQFGRVC